MKSLKLKIKNSRRAGFSLVELLVVITIIAILSVVAYTAVGGNTIKARDSKRMQDLSTIQGALEIYFVEFGVYPNSPLISGSDTGEIPRKYLSTIPVDPKKTAGDTDISYYYYYDSDDKAYMIGATLENEGDNPTAYIVGNYDGVINPSNDSDCNIGVDVTTCLPYDFD